MFIFGLIIGVQIAVLTFAVGYNMGANISNELTKFRKSKTHLLTGVLHDYSRADY